jgi:hypothetical protein
LTSTRTPRSTRSSWRAGSGRHRSCPAESLGAGRDMGGEEEKAPARRGRSTSARRRLRLPSHPHRLDGPAMRD